MRIERLTRQHGRSGFDCGEDSLNRFLREFARQNAAADLGVTYVAVEQGDPAVLGYYTLAATDVERNLLPTCAQPRVRRVPALLLARLAVDVRHRSRGLGCRLMLDCMGRTVRAAEEIGAYALVVDALNDRARDFYERHFGFSGLADDPCHLYLRISTCREAVAPTHE